MSEPGTTASAKYRVSDDQLKDLASRLEFGRPSDAAKNPIGGVVYPDEADAWLKDVVLDLIDARAALATKVAK